MLSPPKGRLLSIGLMLTNELRRAPCGLLGDAKLTPNFFARKAVARRGEKVGEIQPKLKHSAGFFSERRTYSQVRVMLDTGDRSIRSDIAERTER